MALGGLPLVFYVEIKFLKQLKCKLDLILKELGLYKYYTTVFQIISFN